MVIQCFSELILPRYLHGTSVDKSIPGFPCEGWYLFGCLLHFVQQLSLDTKRKSCLLRLLAAAFCNHFICSKQLRELRNCLECWIGQPGGSFAAGAEASSLPINSRKQISSGCKGDWEERCAYLEATVQSLLQLRKLLKADRLRFSKAEGKTCPTRTKRAAEIDFSRVFFRFLGFF